MNEFDIVNKAKNRDQNAFKILFKEYSPKIYAFSLRLSLDTRLAEEITQETFIKVWFKLETFRFESKFSTWIFGIAYNEFLTQLRNNRRLENKHNEAAELGLEKFKDVIHFDTNIDLEYSIAKLPEKQKTVFLLYELEGYKHKEISEILGISEGTSKSHLHTAKKFLKKELLK
ncbi:MAG: RNA polymerase sigma factor [Ignavibacteria bacterium]|nr:RNA polymerase sigma factor [Ignavibacteria bacterium]